MRAVRACVFRDGQEEGVRKVGTMTEEALMLDNVRCFVSFFVCVFCFFFRILIFAYSQSQLFQIWL